MKLTVDKNGNDATSADFDPTNVVQWGFDSQWADNSPTAETALFGAGSFLADDGKTAQIPDAMRTGIHWFNDGVWKDHFIPNQNQVNSDLLAKQPVPVWQPRHDRDPHVVLLLREPGGPGKADRR